MESLARSQQHPKGKKERNNMRDIKPFSSVYYIRENKGRAFIAMFMMFLTVGMLIAGNYIYSLYWTFEPEIEFNDKVVSAEYLSIDETGEDFQSFLEEVKADENLKCVTKTGRGFSSMLHNSVLNLPIGGDSYTFNSVEDMEAVLSHVGIKGDFSNCKNRSVVLSEEFAKDKGIELGDIIGPEFDEDLSAEWTVDAIIPGGGFASFYIYEDDEANHARAYIYSETMEGQELRAYLTNMLGDRQVEIKRHFKEGIDEQFRAYFVIFYAVVILIAVVLAVTVNSVVTGQYMKRIYEFGVYRALGRSKREVKTKVAAEIIGMNVIACAVGIGISSIFTYLINELLYIPTGRYLLYFSDLGIKGFLLCDLMVVIPLVLSKGRMMCKADVTEF